jgi:hypothetical protein
MFHMLFIAFWAFSLALGSVATAPWVGGSSIATSALF